MKVMLKKYQSILFDFVRNNRADFLVLGFFLACSTLFWYPLPFFLRTAELGGLPTDPMYNQWILGWGVHALTHYPTKFFEANMFYPFHNTLAWGDTLFSLTLFAVILKPIFGLIGAYNILLIASSVLSGYFTYLLVKEVTGSRRAGIVGGLIWTITQYRVVEQAHIQMLTTQWIPLMFFFAERLRKGVGKHTIIWFVVATWLMLVTNIYLAIFASLSFVLYAVIMIVLRSTSLKNILKWGLGWLVAGVGAIPIYLPSIMYNLSHPTDRGYNVDSANLTGYLPWPWPGKIMHYVLRHFDLEPKGESIHTIGLISILLLIIAIILLVKQYRKIRAHAFLIFCLVLILVAGLAATGPFTRWGDKIVIDGNPFFTVPYHYLPGYKVLRTIMRWHILTMLGVAVLAAFGSLPLIIRLSRKWFVVVMCVFATWLLVEQANVPWRITPAYKIQDHPVYSWLKNQPGEFAILELPIYPGMNNHQNDLIEARRMYFSTFHWKKRVSGAIAPGIPDAYIKNAEILNAIRSDASGLDLLVEWQVKYIIFLPDDYDMLGWSHDDRDKTQAWLDSQNSLKKVSQFANASVYELPSNQISNKNRIFR